MDALPLKADKIDDIPENFRSLYSASEGGGFQFQTPDALLNVGKHEKAKRQEIQEKHAALEAQFKELNSKYETAAQEKLRVEAEKTGNFETIKKSFDEKAAKIDETYKGQLSAKDNLIKNLTVGQTATKLAASLFGEDADTLQHIIDARLSVELSDGKATVIVLDKSGNPSSLTIDELHTEIYNDSKYARFVVGGKASGGGANGSSAKGGSASQKIMKRSVYDSLSPENQAAHLSSGGTLVQG